MKSVEDDNSKALVKVIKQLLGVVTGLVVLILVLFIYLLTIHPATPAFKIFSDKREKTVSVAPSLANATGADKEIFWTAPDITTLETHPDKEAITYGKSLVAQTALFFGPEGKVKKNATNGMNCQNCHLEAGTKTFGNNYGSVFATYPRYRARSGGMENIYKRINDCFERSLNGQPLDTASKEMKAMSAYINWLGKDVPKGEKAKGSGLKDIPMLDRAANPAKGKIVYEGKCQSCHMSNGEGQVNPEKTAYAFPPLWGNNSYNDGAGLYRISNFAKYVKSNMPLGASYNSAQLTDEEAWDVAAFVNSQPRPKKNIKKDWPKITEKPFDHPFGPYADGFNEQQHKFGPFKPIQEKLTSMKKIK